MFNQRFFLFLLLLGCAVFGYAQERATGLSFDDEAYTKVAYQGPVKGSKFNGTEPYVSLRKYTPLPANQGLTSTCVGHATRNIYTLEKAKRAKLTDREAITAQMHSSGYLYNQIKDCDDCSCGTRMTDALDILKEKGDCLHSTYGEGQGYCEDMPGEAAHKEAGQYRIKDFAAIFKYDESGEVKIEQTIQALNSGKPVLIGMDMTKQLMALEDGNTYFKHKDLKSAMRVGGHAMVVVGYDLIGPEKHFEIMNSYGTWYGDNGFLRLAMDDYGELVKYGFTILLDNDTPVEPTPKPVIPLPVENTVDPEPVKDTLVADVVKPEPKPEPAPVKRVALKGDFIFRYPTGYETDSTGARQIAFAEADAQLNPETGSYELTKKDWKVNDIFQVVGRNMNEGQYVYVYSIDAKGKLEKHWPSDQGIDAFENVRLADYIPAENVEIIMPGEDNALRLANKGRDNLIVLYSEYTVKDVDSRMKTIDISNGRSVLEAVRATFADEVLAADQIKYAASSMNFESNAPETAGTLVPLVLIVEAQ